jgi:hypothetical protein
MKIMIDFFLLYYIKKKNKNMTKNMNENENMNHNIIMMNKNWSNIKIAVEKKFGILMSDDLKNKVVHMHSCLWLSGGHKREIDLTYGGTIYRLFESLTSEIIGINIKYCYNDDIKMIFISRMEELLEEKTILTWTGFKGYNYIPREKDIVEEPIEEEKKKPEPVIIPSSKSGKPKMEVIIEKKTKKNPEKKNPTIEKKNPTIIIEKKSEEKKPEKITINPAITESDLKSILFDKLIADEVIKSRCLDIISGKKI